MTNLFNFLIIVGTILAFIGLIRMPSALRQQQRRTFLLRMQGPGTMSMKIGTICVIIGAVALLFQQ
jgi:uncharacterized membrane protein YidH (DUF202 family)